MIGLRCSHLFQKPMGAIATAAAAGFLVASLLAPLRVTEQRFVPAQAQAQAQAQVIPPVVLSPSFSKDEREFAAFAYKWSEGALNYWCGSRGASREAAAKQMSSDARIAFSTLFWQSQQADNVVRALVWRARKCTVQSVSANKMIVKMRGTLVAYQSGDALKDATLEFVIHRSKAGMFIEKFTVDTQGVKAFVESACAGNQERINKDAILNYEESRHQYLAKDYVQALNACNLALRRSPDFTLARYGRGLVFAELANENPNYRTKYLECALRDHLDALKRNPRLVIAEEKRAECLYLLDRNEEALAEYEDICSRFPAKTEFLSRRGAVKYIMGRCESGLQDMERAVKLNPDSSLAHLNLGWALRFRQPVRAKQLLLRSVFLQPTSDAHNYLGQISHIEGQYQSALLDFTTAIEINPYDQDIYLYRARSFRCLGDYPCAFADLDRSIALKPTWLALEERGHLKFCVLSDPAGALVDIERSIQLDPKRLPTRKILGAILNRLGRSKERETALTEAAAMRASSSIEHYYRADIKLDLGDVEGGISDLTRCIELVSKTENGSNNDAFLKRVYETRAWIRLEKKCDVVGFYSDLFRACEVGRSVE